MRLGRSFDGLLLADRATRTDMVLFHDRMGNLLPVLSEHRWSAIWVTSLFSRLSFASRACVLHPSDVSLESQLSISVIRVTNSFIVPPGPLSLCSFRYVFHALFWVCRVPMVLPLLVLSHCLRRSYVSIGRSQLYTPRKFSVLYCVCTLISWSAHFSPNRGLLHGDS